jgi:glycosyltransferase involved in cell wall biosynthesis
MKLGVLTASASNKAGGIFGAMVGQNKALHRFCDISIEVFGLQDELTQQDATSWHPLSVKTFAVRGPNNFGYSPRLVAALRDAKLDLMHIHGLWMYPSIASSRWARLERKPYLVTTHGMLDPWAVQNSRARKRLAGWLYQDAQLRKATCLQAVTMSEVRAIRAYGLENPICLIPYGIDMPSKGNNTAELLQGTKELLYLGRIHPKKGLINLLNAWHILHQAGKDQIRGWILTIAGWDQEEHEGELKALSSRLGLQQTVRFVGSKFGQAKDSAYSTAHAFILPSFSEGLPVAALEAWSYNLPVLLTPECNIPEGFEARAAIQIGTDPEKIAHGISQLVAMNDDERRAMGLRGREFVEKCFSWRRIAGQMYLVYRWILGEGEKPDCIVD